jgi:3-hydroxyacyl-CoA dehydrogenase
MSEAARDADIAIVVLDNPPVNALSFAVRSAIADGLARARSDASLRALLLIGAGDAGFSGGADIREFGGPARMPGLRELIDELETMQKPVIAALQGNTLGGGFELALGCHFRIALASTRLGLPEVNLGLLPGAGGTQRLPRSIGAAAALDVMLSAKPISGTDAVKLGAVDELAPGTTREELLRAALAFTPPPRWPSASAHRDAGSRDRAPGRERRARARHPAP